MLMALYYLTMNAPDVAITEAAVGAAMSTIFIFYALKLIYKDWGECDLSNNKKRNYRFVLSVTLLCAISLAPMTKNIPAFSNPDNPIHKNVAPYYIENTEKLIGIPNLVTAVLASFRGYDTMGETSVVLIAALAVSLIIKKKKSIHHIGSN